MSELGSHKGNGIRYIMHLSAPNGGVGQMLRHPDGNWVPHENYAHLKGEVGRLRKELEESQENYHLVNELAGKEMTRLQAEVERLNLLTAEMDKTINISQAGCRLLKAEVERLHKAGDAMAEALDLNDDVFDNQEKKEAQIAWNAAKEGKPSV